MSRFNKQWLDALHMLIGFLKSGQTINEALDSLVVEAPKPLQSELVRKNGHIKWMSTTKRIESLFSAPELLVPRVALKLALESGGETSRLLENAVNVLRSQIELEKKKKAFAAQSIVTAWVVALSPLGFLLLLCLVAPDIARLLWVESLGRWILFVVGLLVGLGLLFVQKLVKS